MILLLILLGLLLLIQVFIKDIISVLLLKNQLNKTLDRKIEIDFDYLNTEIRGIKNRVEFAKNDAKNDSLNLKMKKPIVPILFWNIKGTKQNRTLLIKLSNIFGSNNVSN